MTRHDLEARSLSFAKEIQDLLDATLPGTRTISSVKTGQRYVVRPDTERAKEGAVPLFVGGTEVATFDVRLYQELDRTGEYLKTSRTEFKIFSTLDRMPLLRLEYRADMHSAPVSHWQFHAERGAFTHMLALAHARQRVTNPHMLSHVHLPVGGERFRPCLEDVIELLIRDCGVDHHDDWEAAVSTGRERWRRKQLRAAVRDLQQEAAGVLEEQGWAVQPPTTGHPGDHEEPYAKW